jgi:hypothetical protein
MFAIAHELGMTVKELSLTMGAHELAEWIAYFEIRNRTEG